MSTFTAPESGWYRFHPGAVEPEYLGSGPWEEIASAAGVTSFLDEGETRGFANSGSIQTIPNGDWITIPWGHQ